MGMAALKSEGCSGNPFWQPIKAGTQVGPYIIQERIGSVAYRLQLPPQARIHNVFHVAFLKKFEGAPPAAPPPLPRIVHSRVVLQPECVVRTRPTATSWEILVQWQDRSATDAT
jgi:hypothetical protein